MSTLKGRVIVITGASGGIGAATAAKAVKEGARVVLCDLDADALDKAAEPLGDSAAVVVCDVTRFADLEHAVSVAVERFGRLDAMVANAGIEGTVAPLVNQTQENFERVLHVNVLGVWNSIRAAAPSMSTGGSIVITSSVAGFIGSPGLGPYVTSKHAVVGMMRTAAVELAPAGVRVNSVHPGPIDNRMMRSIEEQAAPGNAAAVKSAFEGQVPLGRYGKNEEIASMIAWLCSSESSYCTGQRFVADGGFLAQ
jgi:NAD(P)-dependent dehydrogenase (short-subunit alcohol dehydrogenase family)